MSDELEPKVVPAYFTERELVAMQHHEAAIGKGKEQPLSPSLQSELFELFLNGRSVEDIARLNKLGLGAVVKSASDGDWHRRRLDYTNHLFDTVGQRALQIQAETVHFLSDVLAVATKRHGRGMTLFLQTGDPVHLGEFGVNNMAQMKVALEMFLKATGQDQAKKPVPPEPPATPKNVGGTVSVQPGQPKMLDQETAAQLLAHLQDPLPPPLAAEKKK